MDFGVVGGRGQEVDAAVKRRRRVYALASGPARHILSGTVTRHRSHRAQEDRQPAGQRVLQERLRLTTGVTPRRQWPLERKPAMEVLLVV